MQALLSGTGGMKGLENVNSFGAMSPEMGQALSFMSPGGGLNPQQASQFGPMFGLPVTVVISRDGKVCSKHVGLSSKDTFENEIKSLL